MDSHTDCYSNEYCHVHTNSDNTAFTITYIYRHRDSHGECDFYGYAFIDADGNCHANCFTIPVKIPDAKAATGRSFRADDYRQARRSARPYGVSKVL
jgi:hypothetical protein